MTGKADLMPGKPLYRKSTTAAMALRAACSGIEIQDYTHTLTSYVLRRGAANAIDYSFLSTRADRYCLLTLSRPTGHGSPAEPDNGL